MVSCRTAVIGVGNAYRSDDAVGLYIAEQVLRRGLPGVRVVSGIGDGYDLIEAWSDCDRAIVVDCVLSGGKPGTIYRFDVMQKNIPSDLFTGMSTHNISVTDAIEMAQVMDRLPPSLVVFGVEGAKIEAGATLTDRVRDGADDVVERIIGELTQQSDAAQNRTAGSNVVTEK